MCRQTALSVIRQMTESQHVHRNVLMIEECAPAAIQGTDRCQTWRCQTELRSQMFQHGDRKNLIRVQHAPGHAQETDPQRDAQAVQGTTPCCHRRQLISAQGEELVDLGTRHRHAGLLAPSLLDNAKALILHHDPASREVVLHPRLHAFANHWRFRIRPVRRIARVRRARTSEVSATSNRTRLPDAASPAGRHW
jgi:hypothetical protein